MGVPTMPCPMEMATIAKQQLDNSTDQVLTAKMVDCCSDMETLLKTGKTCKVGQDCKIGSQGLSVYFPTVPASFGKDTFLTRLNDRVIEPRTIPIWRPPA